MLLSEAVQSFINVISKDEFISHEPNGEIMAMINLLMK
ncbi:Hypothetical protein EAG7_01364 [Klebsiella aerogenes]|nr:Hypothetical protein EAG7_01364 [Klebsiella aerogenes]CCG29820.1 hypothetical protein [Klebsiella aerogenes EA1509E]